MLVYGGSRKIKQTKSYKQQNWKSKTAIPVAQLLHTILHRKLTRDMLVDMDTSLSRGPGTSRSFGPCGQGSPLRWNPVSMPAGPCSPGSQQRWSPGRRQCCSPVRTVRLETGLGSPPWRARWWGWGRLRCLTAGSASGTGRRCSPGQWSRRWCWHSPGCKLMADHSSWGKVRAAACTGPRKRPGGLAGVRWLGSRWTRLCFQCWSSGPGWGLTEQRRGCKSQRG